MEINQYIEAHIRQFPILPILWNELDMISGLGEAINCVQLYGLLIGYLQDTMPFVRNNSCEKCMEERPSQRIAGYPELAVTDAIANSNSQRYSSGSRNNSEWNMNDDDYERFFDRI